MTRDVAKVMYAMAHTVVYTTYRMMANAPRPAMRMLVSKTPTAGRTGTKGAAKRVGGGAFTMGMVLKLAVEAMTAMRDRAPNQDIRAFRAR
mmetsp:Transcript_3686/g.13323  ORF Transcript_3686/g.13323 Transcript_3686/m.13323 type:complete len:91 (-) Transcript_3686:1398-1670(-)